MTADKKQSYYFINSLAKATKILELLAETGELSRIRDWEEAWDASKRYSSVLGYSS